MEFPTRIPGPRTALSYPPVRHASQTNINKASFSQTNLETELARLRHEKDEYRQNLSTVLSMLAEMDRRIAKADKDLELSKTRTDTVLALVEKTQSSVSKMEDNLRTNSREVDNTMRRLERQLKQLEMRSDRHESAQTDFTSQLRTQAATLKGIENDIAASSNQFSLELASMKKQLAVEDTDGFKVNNADILTKKMEQRFSQIQRENHIETANRKYFELKFKEKILDIEQRLSGLNLQLLDPGQRHKEYGSKLPRKNETRTRSPQKAVQAEPSSNCGSDHSPRDDSHLDYNSSGGDGSNDSGGGSKKMQSTSSENRTRRTRRHRVSGGSESDESLRLSRREKTWILDWMKSQQSKTADFGPT